MEKIKLIKSTFYHEKETKEALCDFIMKSDILSMADECRKFEIGFSKFQRRAHSVLVTSGSSANLLLIRALLNLGRIKKGQRVGVSSLTWSTNVMPIIEMGLTPVLIDCELDTLNVSLKKLKEKDIDVLFLTNVLGFCSDIDAIEKYCLEKDILFLEDNCESLGSEYKGKLLGNFGLASTFSFFIGHHLPILEGGMVCTDDDELAEALIIARAHGWTRNLPYERQIELAKENNIDEFYNKYSFYDLAYNVRPNEIAGFIGNSQLKYINEIIGKRERNFLKIQTAIEKNSDIFRLDLGEMSVISNFGVPLIFKNKDLFEKYRSRFENEGIEIRPIISGNIANQPFYKKYNQGNIDVCKNSEFVHQHGFYFGNNPEMTREEIDFICSVINGEIDYPFSYYVPLENPVANKMSVPIER